MPPPSSFHSYSTTPALLSPPIHTSSSSSSSSSSPNNSNSHSNNAHTNTSKEESQHTYKSKSLQTLKTLETVIRVLTKRAALEAEYARGLEKLASSVKIGDLGGFDTDSHDTSVNSNNGEKDKSGGSSNETSLNSTLTDALKSYTSNLSAKAHQHSSLSTSITTDLLSELSEHRVTLLRNIKKRDMDISGMTVEFKNRLKDYNKEIKVYSSLYVDGMNAVNALVNNSKKTTNGSSVKDEIERRLKSRIDERNRVESNDKRRLMMQRDNSNTSVTSDTSENDGAAFPQDPPTNSTNTSFASNSRPRRISMSNSTLLQSMSTSLSLQYTSPSKDTLVNWLLPSSKHTVQSNIDACINTLFNLDNTRINCIKSFSTLCRLQKTTALKLQFLINDIQRLDVQTSNVVTDAVKKCIVFDISAGANVMYDLRLVFGGVEGVDADKDGVSFLKGLECKYQSDEVDDEEEGKGEGWCEVSLFDLLPHASSSSVSSAQSNHLLSLLPPPPITLKTGGYLPIVIHDHSHSPTQQGQSRYTSGSISVDPSNPTAHGNGSININSPPVDLQKFKEFWRWKHGAVRAVREGVLKIVDERRNEKNSKVSKVSKDDEVDDKVDDKVKVKVKDDKDKGKGESDETEFEYGITESGLVNYDLIDEVIRMCLKDEVDSWSEADTVATSDEGKEQDKSPKDSEMSKTVSPSPSPSTSTVGDKDKVKEVDLKTSRSLDTIRKSLESLQTDTESSFGGGLSESGSDSGSESNGDSDDGDDEDDDAAAADDSDITNTESGSSEDGNVIDKSEDDVEVKVEEEDDNTKGDDIKQSK